MPTISELLLAQIATESYLNASLNDPDDRFRLGNNNPANADNTASAPILPGATRMTEQQIAEFNELYTFIEQKDNTWSGFSATLLRINVSGEFVLSFRSTEYQDDTKGGDFQRDDAGGAGSLFRSQLDEDALTDIRKAASKELVLGNERFRQEIERALGKSASNRRGGAGARVQAGWWATRSGSSLINKEKVKRDETEIVSGPSAACCRAA